MSRMLISSNGPKHLVFTGPNTSSEVFSFVTRLLDHKIIPRMKARQQRHFHTLLKSKLPFIPGQYHDYTKSDREVRRTSDNCGILIGVWGYSQKLRKRIKQHYGLNAWYVGSETYYNGFSNYFKNPPTFLFFDTPDDPDWNQFVQYDHNSYIGRGISGLACDYRIEIR